MDTSAICSIPECSKPMHLRGYCQSHYKRLLRHGDPLAGGTPRGYPARWIEEIALKFTGDECLPFPFCRDDFGYGKVNWKGVTKGVHVIVCERTHGRKPTGRHEACHSCGNGHLGCANPKHLRWGTRYENMADAMAHGTLKRPNAPRGERAHGAKFSDAQIARVRLLLAKGLTQPVVADLTGVSQAHVSRIYHGGRPDLGVFG